eukprot:9501983-Alexandrium_andersonii.AAC.1
MMIAARATLLIVAMTVAMVMATARALAQMSGAATKPLTPLQLTPAVARGASAGVAVAVAGAVVRQTTKIVE